MEWRWIYGFHEKPGSWLKEEVLISYSIGQVAEKTGLSIHTLRYYEKEGIFPPIKRDEFGARVFDEEAIEWLRFACCLRDTGMTIEEMKGFAQLTLQGDQTIPERVGLLNRQKERVANQIKQLMNNMSMIEHKLEMYKEKLWKNLLWSLLFFRYAAEEVTLQLTTIEGLLSTNCLRAVHAYFISISLFIHFNVNSSFTSECVPDTFWWGTSLSEGVFWYSASNYLEPCLR